jgi:predicted DNA-binding transcriptional regulator YafY
MSTNKNALLRYKTLDRCFQNTGRKYSFDDLMNEVNSALIDDDPKSSGINVRQLRADIQFMRSEAGYSAPIESEVYNGKKHVYFYADPKFSIHNSPLNETEAKQLKNALGLFQRFSGSPGFEWVEEMNIMLKNKFGGGDDTVISFQSNIDYEGYKWISDLFNAIVQKRALWITYTPFNSPSFSFIFHPYYLKQYNNRWFVYGLNQELGIYTWNLSLDRIEDINEAKIQYETYDFDWEYYFSDIIGVTRYDKQVENIELLFNHKRAKYVETLPLHESQRGNWTDDGYHVKLKLIPNLELEQVILSFGEDVEVLQPLFLRESVAKRIAFMQGIYNQNTQ